MRVIARRGRWAGVLTAFAFAGVGAVAPAPAAASTASTAPKPAPSLTEALISVGDLSHELKLIDRRLVGLEHALASLEKSVGGIGGSLASLEKSVGSIDGTLAPVGALVRPEGLRAALDPIVDSTLDRAFDRARGLLLLATACAAGLIVLHALMRRWTARPQRST
ncbi:MAG: hypothetical protein EHM87_13785 [Burkholderiales bacterium]|nr:MAG: hypothetical protein EHM87_13785 [Burkholderiales bacterium]